MKHPVIVPSPGESINEVFIGTWLKKSGDLVKKDETLVDLETQKTTFELQAEQSGRIEVLFPDRETVVKPGDTIAYIDDSASGVQPSAPAANASPKAAAPTPVKASSAGPILSPAARKIASEQGLNAAQLQGSGKDGRVLKEDVLQSSSRAVAAIKPASKAEASPATYDIDTERGERLVPTTRIRRQIAQNLVAAQQTAAILTTFNEVDMSQVIALRKQYKETLKAKHGINLGFVSFFALAAVRALKEFPMVNGTFTEENIILRDFVDMGIAVGTENGLVVPVVRDADKMDLIEFERRLSELSEKARTRKLSIAEMTGGTFTISNGGVFGSLMSTPILNMPQSGILGLHKTQERPVVVDGQIVIRPMMYLALSYDHRIIDGREAVLFLVKVKEVIENFGQAVDMSGW